MNRHTAATKIQALWRGYRARRGPLRQRTRLTYKPTRLRGRYGKVRTRFPTAGAFVSPMKVQVEPIWDNLQQTSGDMTQQRTTNHCTCMYLSPLSDGNADRTLINGGTLLGANIELTIRNTQAYAHSIRVSVVEAITEDKPITSSVALDWASTSHFNDFFKLQTAASQDEDTIPWIGSSGPTQQVAQYAAINTDKFRVLKTKWINMGTDAGNTKTLKGCHMYVPLKRHIDKDTIINSYTPKAGGNTENNRYSYGKPVFLLIESFIPPGRTEVTTLTYAYVSGQVKFAFKDK